MKFGYLTAGDVGEHQPLFFVISKKEIMKKTFITALAFACIFLAACGSSDNSTTQTADSSTTDTVGAQSSTDSLQLVDSAVNRADKTSVDTAK